MGSRFRRFAGALALSTAIHVGCPATYFGSKEAYPYVRRAAEFALSRINDAASFLRIQYERERLIIDARAQLRRGEFRMGDFLIKAGELDARERGETLDIQRARSIYTNYQNQLRSSLDSGHSLQESIPGVLSEFRYYSDGSDMATALLRNGGSCGQISHLVASLVYDVGGYENNIFFRRYRPNSRGYGHVAPIFVEDGRSYDLVGGDYAFGGGRQNSTSSVIDDYARMHSLAPPNSEDTESVENSSEEGTFPGGAPMFGGSAIRSFNPDEEHIDRMHTNSDSERLPSPYIHPSWYRFDVNDLIDLDHTEEVEDHLTLNDLEPGIYYFTEPLESLEEVEPHPRIALNEIETNMSNFSRNADDVEVWLRNYNFSGTSGLGSRVLLLSYLSKLYQKIAQEAEREEIGGRYSFIAERARTRRTEVMEEASEILRNLPTNQQSQDEFVAGMSSLANVRSGVNGNHITYLNMYINYWNIAFAGEEGARFLLGRLDEFNSDNSRNRVLVAMLSNPSTYEMTMERISTLSPIDQIILMGFYTQENTNAPHGGRVISANERNEHQRAYDIYQSFQSYNSSISRYAHLNQFLGNDGFDYIINSDSDSRQPDLNMAVMRNDIRNSTNLSFQEFHRIIQEEVRREGLDDRWVLAFTVYYSESELVNMIDFTDHIPLGVRGDYDPADIYHPDRLSYAMERNCRRMIRGGNPSGCIDLLEQRFASFPNPSLKYRTFTAYSRYLLPSFEFTRDYLRWLESQPSGQLRDASLDRVRDTLTKITPR